MYISMSILWEELNKTFALTPFRPKSLHGRILSGAALFSGSLSSVPDIHTVYIVKAGRLPVKWKSAGPVSLIVIGSLPEHYFENGNTDYFCVKDKKFLSVFNKIQQIFQKYSAFDNDIKQNLLKNVSSDRLCGLIADFLKIPFLVFDESLRIQYISPAASCLLEWETDLFSGLKIMPTEFINLLNLVYLEKAKNFFHHTVLLKDDRLPYNLITTLNGKDSYIIVAFETTLPFTQATLEIIDYIREFILLSFQNTVQKTPLSHSLSSVILSMLEGIKFSTVDLKNRLETIGWQITDCCCCLVIYPLNQQGSTRYSYINTFCLKLENQFQECIALPYKERVVAIINLEKSGYSFYDIPHNISLLLRDGLLKAGISFKFWDFETTPIYYRQACYAYEMGKVYNPSLWCYIFENYALYHFMHYGSSRLPPRHLCHPALVQLHRYDEKNGTELLKTLETYVQNNCNAVTSANALYIHRNTFYQRINKIREMLHINLEDPKVRLYLLISTQLINMYYYELENEFIFPHE